MWKKRLQFTGLFLAAFLLRVSILPAFGRNMQMIDPLWLGLLFFCLHRQWSQAYLWAFLAGLFVMPYENISEGVLMVGYVISVKEARYLLRSIFTHERWHAVISFGLCLSFSFWSMLWLLNTIVTRILDVSGLAIFNFLNLLRFTFLHTTLFFLIWGGLRLYMTFRNRV